MLNHAFSKYRTYGVAVAVAALTLLTITAAPAIAGAGGAAPVGSFGIVPAPGTTARGLSYFSLALGPGQSTSSRALIRNLGPAAVTLKVGASVGRTAVNGGAAYTGAFRACAGTGCWVTGLPSTITLAAHATRQVTFTVRVPRGTRPGQYLAGISVASADNPAPVRVAHKGKASVEAIIVETVTAGLAVTVGTLSDLTWKFTIPTVTGVGIGSLARLVIRLHNSGQAFQNATGTAACTAAGKRHSFRVDANVILPGQSAAISVNAPGVPEGSGIPCTVRLHYGRDQTVSWTGDVTFVSSGKRLVRIGPHSYALLSTSTGIPSWAWALGALLVACLLVVAAMLVLRRRRLPARS